MRNICLTTVIAVVLSLVVMADSPTPEQAAQEIQQAIEAAGAEWTAGVTWVSRLSQEEKRALCGDIDQEVPDALKRLLPTPDGVLPPNFDWRDNGGDWTTPIRNQGSCGSCWDFAATAVFEALINIDAANPALDMDLSEQYVLSCCPSCGSCSGGWSNAALDFYCTTGGVTETCLPYQADDAVLCGDACVEPHVYLGDWAYIIEDVEAIKSAIYYYGPISASFEVYADFYSYVSGVYEHVWGDYLGGHAISIVGWDDAGQYWICKNSWDTGFGESGWFNIRWGECDIEGRRTVAATMTTWPAGTVAVTVLDGSGVGVTDAVIYVDGDYFGLTAPDGTLALDLIEGMYYSVVAYGYDEFLLYDSVAAPGSLVLDCRTASHVTLSTAKRDGSPLDAYLNCELDDWYFTPGTTSSGTGSFYITPGIYDFQVRSQSAEMERYCLAIRDVDLTSSTAMAVDASSMSLAEWRLDTLLDSSAGPYTYDQVAWPAGFRWGWWIHRVPGESIFYNVGDWSVVGRLYEASSPPYEWSYSWVASQLTFFGGELYPIEAGGDLVHATSSGAALYPQGSTAQVRADLCDAFDNSFSSVSRYDSTAMPPGDGERAELDEVVDQDGLPADGGTYDNFYPWLTVTPPTDPAIFDEWVYLENWNGAAIDPAAELGTYAIRSTIETHLGVLEALSSFDVVEPDPDPYEPNDTCETAYDVGSVAVGAPFASDVAHFLDPNEDWFVFDIATEGQLVIEPDLLGADADPIIYLYDACGADPIAFDTSYSPRISHIVTPGRYYLRINQYTSLYGGETEYTFTIDLVLIPAIAVVGPETIVIEAPIGTVSMFEDLFEVQNVGQPGSELSYRILWQEITDPPAAAKATALEPGEFPFELPSESTAPMPRANPPIGDWDLLCFDPDEPEDSLMDFAELYAQIDGTTLYFRGVTHLPWTSRPDDVFGAVFLDIDQDSSTGWQFIEEIGMEYYLAFGTGWGELWGCNESGDWYIGSLDYVSMPDDANEFVVGVNLSRLDLGDRSPAAVGGFNLCFYGRDYPDELFVMDLAPDAGHVCYPPEVLQVCALPDCGNVMCGDCAEIGLRIDGTDPDFFGSHLIRLYFVSNDSTVTPTRDILITAGEPTPAVFRVGSTGDVLADGTFYASGFLSGSADIAEWVNVSEPVEPGDVLELDPENPGQYRKARSECLSLVGGVVATQPGFTLGGETVGSRAIMALVGIVPVKACDEGGPIELGDLLVPASIPGYVRRWDPETDTLCPFVGKALAALEQGEGMISILLTR